jgi:flagellar hook-associated protein 3 FlgL
MVSILNATHLQFLNNLNHTQSLLSQVQGQISSGLAVNTPSDAPDQVSAILQLHSDIQQNEKLTQNLTQVQGQVQTADSNLSSGITLLDQVMSLATGALSTSSTAATRATMADQVATLMQQMVGISNTAVNGKYIFSGDNSGSPSYSYNASSPTGVDRLQVSASTQQAQDGSGGSFSIGLSANQIFDARDSSDNPTQGNVFKAMNDVRTALLNNDTTGLQTALSSVQGASSYLNQQQGFYGSVENRLTSVLDQANSQNISLQADLSSRQDVDETKAILEMQQYTVTLQAAIAAESKMPTTTLFNDLPA